MKLFLHWVDTKGDSIVYEVTRAQLNALVLLLVSRAYLDAHKILWDECPIVTTHNIRLPDNIAKKPHYVFRFDLREPRTLSELRDELDWLDSVR